MFYVVRQSRTKETMKLLLTLALLLAPLPTLTQYHEGQPVRVRVGHHWRPARVISEYGNFAVWVDLGKYKSGLVLLENIKPRPKARR